MLDYPRLSAVLNVPNLEQRLKAPSKAPLLVDVRRALVAILREQGYSHSEIAREFQRDSSTIRYLAHTHRNLLDTDTKYQWLVRTLRESNARENEGEQILFSPLALP